MTDPELLRGRAVGKVIQRGEHLMLMFSVPGRADVPEIRLYLPLDGEVVLDPEPADVGEVDLQKLFYLYDLAAQVCGIAGVRHEFTGGDRGWKGDVPIVRFNCAKIQALGWRSALEGKGRYLPLQDDISSTAFWYQLEPHAPFPELGTLNDLEVI